MLDEPITYLPATQTAVVGGSLWCHKLYLLRNVVYVRIKTSDRGEK